MKGGDGHLSKSVRGDKCHSGVDFIQELSLLGFHLEVEIGMTSMLNNIQTLEFLFFGNPQTYCRFYDSEQDIAATERPDKGGSNTKELDADKMGGHTLNVEESGGQGSPSAIDAMHGDGADRIVDADSVKEQD